MVDHSKPPPLTLDLLEMVIGGEIRVRPKTTDFFRCAAK